MRLSLFKRGIAAALLMGGAASECFSAEQGSVAAEQVFLHGKVYTATDALPWAEAVAIAHGKIIAVGSESEIRALTGPATQVTDLHGGMLMPGLIDSHSHPIAGGRQESLASVGGKPLDLEAFKAFVDHAIADGSALHGDRVVIVGIHPSLWSLDLASVFNRSPYASRPILFAGEDAHTGWANRAMLKVLGITAATVAAMPPDKRQYFRVDAHGEPTGFATEAGASQLFRALPGRDGTYDPSWGRRAVEYYNERGVTAVLEANAGHPPEDGETVLHVYRELSEQGRLTLHVAALLQAETVEDLPKIYELRQKYAGLRNFAVVGVKMFADGILEYPAQTAAVIRPYRNSGKSGVLKIPPRVMNAIAVDADRHGMFVHIHAIGDRAVHEALDAIEAARRANPNSRLPHTLAHLQLVDPGDIPRFGSLHAVASFQLLWAAADEGEVKLVKPYIDPASYARQYPARSVNDAGGIVAGGSDWPVTSGNPWEAIAQAMTRKGPYGVLGESERLTLPVLLRAYTINAAKALGMESSIGSIEAGKEADLVLLPRDITQLEPHAIATLRPIWTRVHGVVVTPAVRDSG